MILFTNKITQLVSMCKSCNLSTVQNTPSEARRNTSTVEYYFINFHDNSDPVIVPRWRTLRAAIECIWELLEDVDLYFIGGLYICAYHSDGNIRRVRYIALDKENRHIKICRVK